MKWPSSSGGHKAGSYLSATAGTICYHSHVTDLTVEKRSMYLRTRSPHSNPPK